MIGTGRRLAGLTARIAKELPEFDLGLIESLEEYAMALSHAHTLFSLASQSADPLGALVEEGIRCCFAHFLSQSPQTFRDCAVAKPSEPPSSIPEDVARFAQSQVSAGRFASVDDVLRAGVEAIQQRDEAAEDWLAYARDAWSRGVQSLDAGKAVLTTDEEFEAFLDDCVPPDPH